MAQATWSVLLICATLGLASGSLMGSHLSLAHHGVPHTDLVGLVARSQGPVIEFGMKAISGSERLIRSVISFIPGVKLIDFGVKSALKALDTLRYIRESFPGRQNGSLNRRLLKHVQSVHGAIISFAVKSTCKIMSRAGGYDSKKCSTCLEPLPHNEATTLHSTIRDISRKLLGTLYPERLVHFVGRFRKMSTSNFYYLDGYVDCKDSEVGRKRGNCRDLRKESVAINVITIPISVARWVTHRLVDAGDLLLTLTHGTLHRISTTKDAYRRCLHTRPF